MDSIAQSWSVLSGAGDAARRPSQRLKDLADIAHLLEVAPDLQPLVPPEILAKLI